ncbi:MAG: formate/nitrite transporter family protein [Clostridia bacterium]|nr:formate/nitrite transporter family protein [Clostridia bacterium]
MKMILKQSILAGAMVGIGVVVNSIAGNPYIGSMLFSVALLVIICCDLKLYTGKIGFIGQIPVPHLACMLIGNLIGVLFPVLLQYPDVISILIESAATKFAKSLPELFADGVLCGALMYAAVASKDKIATVFCIMAFILSGYEHCIASFPHLILNFSVSHLVKFITIVAANSIGSILFGMLCKKETE